MTVLALPRIVHAVLWLAVAGWKALVFLALLTDFDVRWPVAVFALVMAGMTAWAAVQWRGWMLAGREWPRVQLQLAVPLALAMLLLPLKVLSVEFGG